ncbi:MAG: DUF2975 domain-containing protein [Hyphomonadaceae bacterium]|nr:DUF2975 domain-containing protein [Hyphomonadaceae bacterium]
MKALGKGSIASIVEIGLTIAWYVLWAAAICLAVGAVGYAVVLVLIQNGTVDPAILSGGEGHVRLGGGDGSSFHLTYNDPGGATWPVVVPALLIGGVAITGSLIIVWRLRKLFDSFTSGEPFRRENAQHLRAIWMTMLAIEVARYLLLALTAALLAAFEPDIDANFTFNLDLSTWGSILILIVLAEVFREGARLREEQELTI